ncbi:hypothetical protein RKE30_05875 [Streptomyces sp. Li-HN-5-11]|nr:hypothetical protein [Streptomyces sp. Li-HN-5-11]WNM29960.1 hypothetical protein RKE30_05875 [Streptomyces sp. Li-HN-5-11]
MRTVAETGKPIAQDPMSMLDRRWIVARVGRSLQVAAESSMFRFNV